MLEIPASIEISELVNLLREGTKFLLSGPGLFPPVNQPH